jgi:hypothetical protein
MYFDGAVNVSGNGAGAVTIFQEGSNILFQPSYNLIAQTIRPSMRLLFTDSSCIGDGNKEIRIIWGLNVVNLPGKRGMTDER